MTSGLALARWCCPNCPWAGNRFGGIRRDYRHSRASPLNSILWGRAAIAIYVSPVYPPERGDFYVAFAHVCKQIALLVNEKFLTAQPTRVRRAQK